MGKEVALLEVSKLPVGGKDKEEDDGIELSLDLSLGGRYEDSKNLRKKIENPFEEQLQNLGFGNNNGIGPRSDFYCLNGDETMVWKKRREFQAFRRREARRKREAKTKAWRFIVEDKSLLEGRRFQGRVHDRETKEGENFFLGRKNGKNKNELSLSLNTNQMHMPCPSLYCDTKLNDVSDHQSTSSRQGGSSTDSGSHTSPFAPSQCHIISERSDHDSPPLAQLNKILEHQTTEKSQRTTCPDQTSLTSSQPSKEKSNRVLRKPPKPPSQSPSPSARSTMPCVSVKGNGPNGKTVTGFLCKYTATEIVITCVCHGTSLSPAEFVEHAGGINVTHPLRHITMVTI